MGAPGRGCSHSGERCFPRVPSPRLLRETIPQHLRGRPKRWPRSQEHVAAECRQKGRGSCLGDNLGEPAQDREGEGPTQTPRQPYRARPVPLIHPHGVKLAGQRLHDLEHDRAHTATSTLSIEHQCHMDACLSGESRKSFLINPVLTESLLCSKPCQAFLLYGKGPRLQCDIQYL